MRKDSICESCKFSKFLLGGVLGLVHEWFGQMVRTILGDNKVDLDKTMMAILGKCQDGFGSHLYWKIV